MKEQRRRSKVEFDLKQKKLIQLKKTNEEMQKKHDDVHMLLAK